MKMTVMPGERPKPPLAVYLIGILGIIPLIGAARILWSVFIYGSLFIFTQSKTMGKLMVPSARESLSNLAKELEFYKYENGVSGSW
jgi:hypothetical protein